MRFHNQSFFFAEDQLLLRLKHNLLIFFDVINRHIPDVHCTALTCYDQGQSDCCSWISSDLKPQPVEHILKLFVDDMGQLEEISKSIFSIQYLTPSVVTGRII